MDILVQGAILLLQIVEKEIVRLKTALFAIGITQQDVLLEGLGIHYKMILLVIPLTSPKKSSK